MKIKSYPGRAIFANESPEKLNSMGQLYEANWMNANERIKQTSHLAYSKSNSNISSLGKYQDQLERAKNLEIDQPNERTLRDFHGYKPSTLKIKKSLVAYNEWDNEPNTNDEVFHNPLYNNQNNWHSSGYLPNKSNKRSEPKLRRSQTVIVKQPTTDLDDNIQGEIDLRDFYRRRHQLRQNELQTTNANVVQKNCDIVPDYNDSFYSSNLSASTRNHKETSANRMNSYTMATFFEQNENKDNSENCENKTGNGKILLNPLTRNKSIKINHFDTLGKPQRLKPEEVDGGLCDTEGLKGKKTKKNSFSRMFATISAGTKFPRVFLGRGSKNQRAKLNLEELNENAESQQSNSSLSTLSSSPTYPSSPSAIADLSKFSNSSNRKHGSATSSDSDSFVIPRPHFIVPVHLPRKRRTGNLASEQSISSKARNCDRTKGKTSICKVVFFSLHH